MKISRFPFFAAAFALSFGSSADAAEPLKPSPKKEDAGYFFAIEGAKDCAYDQLRERLYVTTPKALVVVDTKARKILETVELLGTLQGCDISPDFKFLVIAPIAAQFIYKVKLDWKKHEDMEISQIKFKAAAMEPGVYGIAVGADNSVIFSTTFAGSGGVRLRRLNADKETVDDVGRINMNSILTASGDRNFAAVAEGNISTGPLQLYDFKQKTLKLVAGLDGFNYEIGCSHDAKYFARPVRKGCDLFDASGGRMGTLEGAPVICAAFHPKNDTLFVMRAGELNIEEYDIQGKKVANSYPLDKPLMIRADVRVSETVDLQPVGRDRVIANVRTRVNVIFRTYASGRLKLSENGESMFAVIPAGAYMFAVKAAPPATADTKPKPKITVVDPTDKK